MPQQKDPEAQDETLRDELLADRPVTPLEDEVVTLEFKQNAYWLGTLRMAGERMKLPRAEAQDILRTTELFRPV